MKLLRDVILWDGGSNVDHLLLAVSIFSFPNHFLLQSYKELVPKDTKKGSVITKISAVDIDEGLNQEIKYSISGNKEDLDFFDIDPVTGVIKLKKEINVSLVYFLFIL